MTKRPRTVFVTASGTEIGKTYSTVALIREWRRRGETVTALKPVLSDFDQAAPAGSDAALIAGALGEEASPDVLERVSPWRFKAPLSPDMAARREGRQVPFKALLSFCEDARDAGPGPLVIEGVGGVMVPLDDENLVIDWMSALHRAVPLDVVLVTGSYLGTISHTLTANAVLGARGLKPAVVAVSETPGSTVDMGETVETLQRFLPESPVIALERAADGLKAGRKLADMLDASDVPAPAQRSVNAVSRER